MSALDSAKRIIRKTSGNDTFTDWRQVTSLEQRLAEGYLGAGVSNAQVDPRANQKPLERFAPALG
jgi:hypothetical protein